MEFKNSQKKIFKTENRQSVPDRLKQKVNEFLEKKGKPKRFDIPDKKDENKQ